MAHKTPESPLFHNESDEWQALELIADKWTLIVLSVLSSGRQRHGQLCRAIKGISPKMLTQTLRHMERDGLVARRIYPVIPPKVEYTLTPLGQTVVGPLEAMCQWAEEHWPAVLAAREAYSNQASGEEEDTELLR